MNGVTIVEHFVATRLVSQGQRRQFGFDFNFAVEIDRGLVFACGAGFVGISQFTPVFGAFSAVIRPMEYGLPRREQTLRIVIRCQ